MSAVWIPKNWDEICKRNAGRKKLHIRKRQERANRIMSLLMAMEKAPVLRETAHGWLTIAAEIGKVSKATASRDFALGRQIHRQFIRMFGRTLDLSEDEIIWSWDWAHYGFRTNESRKAGYHKPVGKFPFNTRDVFASEEAYCGFDPSTWHSESGRSGYDLIREMNALVKVYDRLSKIRGNSF